MKTSEPFVLSSQGAPIAAGAEAGVLGIATPASSKRAPLAGVALEGGAA